MKVRTITSEYTDAELLHWYDLLMECNEFLAINQGKPKCSKVNFCRRKGIDPQKLQWFYFRFFFKFETDPELHIREIEIAKSYRESGLEKREFCKLHNYPVGKLSAADMHLTYRGRLDKLLEKGASEPQPKGLRALLDRLQAEGANLIQEQQEEKPMSFHQVPAITKQEPTIPPPQVISPKKEIELITDGVRVIVSHGAGHEKLIKIIEFLEGL